MHRCRTGVGEQIQKAPALSERAEALTGQPVIEKETGVQIVVEINEKAMTTLAHFTHPDPLEAAAGLRLTDEVAVAGEEVTALLRGCDEVDALAVLGRLGARDPYVRLASRHELLGGPTIVGIGAPAGPTPGTAPAR